MLSASENLFSAAPAADKNGEKRREKKEGKGGEGTNLMNLT
jgi:hypothetical protein